MIQATDPILSLTGITKLFAGVPALRGIDLQLFPGEVVGLLGENGAGKSTLINILSGVHRPEHGSMILRGRPTTFFHEPAQALKEGISTVYQHSMLAENLTVAENIVLGNEPGTNGISWWTRKKQTRHVAKQIADEVGLEVNLDARADTLTVAERQRVEIVRAVHGASGVIIFDEPTAALAPDEVLELFDVIRKLRARGNAVLYVSHRLDEIPIICDRTVILRDGRLVGELDAEHSVPDEIIPLLVGKQLGDQFPEQPDFRPETALSILNVSGDAVAPTSFDVRFGEIVGLNGAVGAGHRNLARTIYGVDRGAGVVKLDNRIVPRNDPSAAIRHGIAYVSGDRKNDGIIPTLSVWRNITLILARDRGWMGFLSKRQERRVGLQLLNDYDVRTASPEQSIATLSGGNQQKAILARFAGIQPKVLILDEPTLGVDVGARRQIYDQIVSMARRGMAVLLVSSDHTELRGLSHRVLVFDRGQVVAELGGNEVTEESVLRARSAAQPNYLNGQDLGNV